MKSMKARDVNARIEKLGGEQLRQKGSHRMYLVETDAGVAQTTVPQHGGDIPIGLLSKIQRDLAPVLGKKWLQ